MAEKDVTQMTNDEFFEFVVGMHLGGWIPVKKYRQLFPSETQSAIHTRIHRGIWTKGVHVRSPRGGGMWVNLPAIRLWIDDEQ